MFNVFKSNSGMSLIEVMIGVVLASGVGFVSVEAQKNTSTQVRTISVYETSAILRESFLNLIGDKSYLAVDVRGANSSLRGCIPNSFGAGAKFIGTCTTGKELPIQLVTPDPSSNLRFAGKSLGDKVILAAGKEIYFNEKGEVCDDPKAKSCSIAVKGYLKAICTSGSCGAGEGPDAFKISVELKDHRSDIEISGGKTAKDLPWANKPSFYKFYSLHDLSLLKQSNRKELDMGGCPNKTISGVKNVPGYPVQIENGKLVCGYHDPANYIGLKGKKGIDGKNGPDGPRGPSGFQGPSGSRGKNCISNRTGKGGCSDSGWCPKTFVVSC